MSLDFAIDLPHPVYVFSIDLISRTDYYLSWRSINDFKPVIQMQQYMSHIINTFCSQYSCVHFHPIRLKRGYL